MAGRDSDGSLPLTFAVFAGVYVASKLESRFGAADGKLMVGLAAFAPLALALAVFLEGLVFVVLRLQRRHGVSIPGAFWLLVAALLTVVVLLCTTTR